MLSTAVSGALGVVGSVGCVGGTEGSVGCVAGTEGSVGCVAEEQIVGKLVYKVWPIKSIGKLSSVE